MTQPTDRGDQPTDRGDQTAGAQQQDQPARIIPDKLSIYYSNCAMVATTPVDISLYFGRYVQTNTQDQGPTLAELYERQIYMTLEQAKKLAQVLNQTIQGLEARQAPATDHVGVSTAETQLQGSPTIRQAPPQQKRQAPRQATPRIPPKRK